jgi:mono/diheme cytochrome c family protein
MALPGLVMLSIAAPARSALDPWEALVATGRNLWTRAPEPGPPVACVTCHGAPEAASAWAASYPRFRPLPPPHGRVMTLLQAVAEATERHYPGVDAQPAAAAITAYLATIAAGRPITPGLEPGAPIFERRLAALTSSVARGQTAFLHRCAACHGPDSVAPVVVAWARLVRAGGGPPEAFLETHPRGRPRLRWNGPETADLLAFLVARLAGRPFVPDASAIPSEVTR